MLDKMGRLSVFNRKRRAADGTTPSAGSNESLSPPATAAPLNDAEKIKPVSETAAIEQETEQDPEVAALPLEVRQLVSLTDDPTLPTITDRKSVV